MTVQIQADTRPSGPAWHKLAAIGLLLLALAAIWRYTPLAEYVIAERVTEWADMLADAPWAPFALVLFYTPAAFVMFPRPLITLAAVLAFGPWLGFTFAITGITVAALVSYYAGRAMPCAKVQEIAGKRAEAVCEVLRRRGFLAVLAVRIVPIAPFVVIGIVAGALRVKLWHFTLATIVGVLPGTLMTTVFGDQLQAALEDPSTINYWLVGGVVVLFAIAMLLMRRWVLRHHRSALQL